MTSAFSAAAARLTGIHAATVCPMDDTGRIVESALATHLDSVAAASGIRGLLLNGHAGEGHLLEHEEKGRVLGIARETVPDACFITAGITSESTAAACLEAENAARAGADAVLVFPPNHWASGFDAEIALAHHRAVADAAGLPVVLYRAPVSGRLSYDPATLYALLELDAVAGIKEGSWEVASYEELWRQTKARRPDVSVMGSGDEHLLTSYLIGSDGSQVSLAAIIPETVVALFDASKAGDWTNARELHETLYDLSVAIYRDAPSYLATARLKTCLKLLGRIECDHARLPMRPLSAHEAARLAMALGLQLA